MISSTTPNSERAAGNADSTAPPALASIKKFMMPADSDTDSDNDDGDASDAGDDDAAHGSTDFAAV